MQGIEIINDTIIMTIVIMCTAPYSPPYPPLVPHDSNRKKSIVFYFIDLYCSTKNDSRKQQQQRILISWKLFICIYEHWYIGKQWLLATHTYTTRSFERRNKCTYAFMCIPIYFKRLSGFSSFYWMNRVRHKKWELANFRKRIAWNERNSEHRKIRFSLKMNWKLFE